MSQPCRKRSATFTSLRLHFLGDVRSSRDNLQASNVNSLASGIASFSERPRAGTWHGELLEKEDITDNSTETNEEDPEMNATQELIRGIIVEELDRHLTHKDYDRVESVEHCTSISQEVENRVRDLVPSDAKLIAVVYIGEIRDQGIEITSQCLWNPEKDNFATASFRNKTLFAVCTVFTVMKED